jgi:hypothetical protein
MVEVGHHSGFGQVSFSAIRTGYQFAMRHLNGHRTQELIIVRQIDEAKSALTQD